MQNLLSSSSLVTFVNPMTALPLSKQRHLPGLLPMGTPSCCHRGRRTSSLSFLCPSSQRVAAQVVLGLQLWSFVWEYREKKADVHGQGWLSAWNEALHEGQLVGCLDVDGLKMARLSSLL